MRKSKLAIAVVADSLLCFLFVLLFKHGVDNVNVSYVEKMFDVMLPAAILTAWIALAFWCVKDSPKKALKTAVIHTVVAAALLFAVLMYFGNGKMFSDDGVFKYPLLGSVLKVVLPIMAGYLLAFLGILCVTAICTFIMNAICKRFDRENSHKSELIRFAVVMLLLCVATFGLFLLAGFSALLLGVCFIAIIVLLVIEVNMVTSIVSCAHNGEKPVNLVAFGIALCIAGLAVSALVFINLPTVNWLVRVFGAWFTVFGVLMAICAVVSKTVPKQQR